MGAAQLYIPRSADILGPASPGAAQVVPPFPPRLQATGFKGNMEGSSHRDEAPGFLKLAFSDGTPRHALVAGFIIGTLLTVINQGDRIWAGEMPNLVKIVLTYLVPYCVTTYGAVTAKRATLRRRAD